MGYGDWLMLSGRVRELQKSFPGMKIVVTPEMEKSSYFREVFYANPYITLHRALGTADPYICVANHLPGRLSEDGKKFVWYDDFQAVRGDLFFTRDEIAFASQALGEIRSAWQSVHGRPPPRVIVVNPWAKRKQLYADGSLRPYHHATNKEWGIDKYQQLVARIADHSAVVQFTQHDDTCGKVLKNVLQVGCESFRQAVAVLKSCDLYVGAEGGLHHGAAAVGKPAVVIFGGWISPKTTGYAYHDNIYVGDPNFPCGARYPCAHCSACMEKISIDAVFGRINLRLADLGTVSPSVP